MTWQMSVLFLSLESQYLDGEGGRKVLLMMSKRLCKCVQNCEKTSYQFLLNFYFSRL